MGDCEFVDSTPMRARATSGASGHCARRVVTAMITLVASLSLVAPALAAPRYDRCPGFLWSGGAFSTSVVTAMLWCVGVSTSAAGVRAARWPTHGPVAHVSCDG